MRRAEGVLLHPVALLARRMQKSLKKFLLDKGKGCGKSVRLVKPADFSFDPGWFAKIRQELVGSEQLEKCGAFCKTRFPAHHRQQPVSNKQGKHGVANPCFRTKLFNLVHVRN
jgi:hypothetical protein